MTIRVPLRSALLALTVLLASCSTPEPPTDTPVDAPEETLAEAAERPAAVGADWSTLLPNARQPLPGVVSGGQPSAEQLDAAAAAGFETVINLRTAGEPGELTEEGARVEELGMDYLSLPIAGAPAITEENARALAELLAEAERPVLLHCGSGNRIGALLALKGFHVDGLDAAEALEHGREAGLTRLEGTVREHLEGAAAAEESP